MAAQEHERLKPQQGIGGDGVPRMTSVEAKAKATGQTCTQEMTIEAEW